MRDLSAQQKRQLIDLAAEAEGLSAEARPLSVSELWCREPALRAGSARVAETELAAEAEGLSAEVRAQEFRYWVPNTLKAAQGILETYV